MSVLFIQPPASKGQPAKTYNPAKFDSTEVAERDFEGLGKGHFVIAQIGEQEIPLTRSLEQPLAERVHHFLLQYFQATGGTVQMEILTQTATAALEVEALRARVSEAEVAFDAASKSVIAGVAVPDPVALEAERKDLEAKLVQAQKEAGGTAQKAAPEEPRYDLDAPISEAPQGPIDEPFPGEAAGEQ